MSGSVLSIACYDDSSEARVGVGLLNGKQAQLIEEAVGIFSAKRQEVWKSLSVLLDTTVGNEGSQGRSVSGVQFSLDPVVRMRRPADRKACLFIPRREAQEFCF